MTDIDFIKELREIKKEIRKGLKEVVSEEPINEDDACKFLGISRQTMRQYVCIGKMEGTYVLNRLGKRMFYKSKLYTK